MSLLNDLAEGVLGSLQQNAQQAQGVQSGLMELLNQAGGISGLADKFQRGGLGGIISSWIGTGANEPISGDQMRDVIGSDLISNLAAKLGFDASQTASVLTSVLPTLIDKLTPDGRVPEKIDPGEALAGLFKH